MKIARMSIDAWLWSFVLFCGLAVIAVDVFAQTVTIPAQTITVTIPAQTITLPVQGPTPPAPVDPTGASWGYHAGVFSWAGDYSYGATIDYKSPLGIAVKTTQWGAWQPFMSASWSFPTAGYTKLTFALQPTKANQQWQVRFIGVGDVPLAAACNLDVLKYGPAPAVGKFATYTIPLAELCVLGKPVYKFAIQDQTGLASNLWYVNDAGFLP